MTTVAAAPSLVVGREEVRDQRGRRPAARRRRARRRCSDSATSVSGRAQGAARAVRLRLGDRLDPVRQGPGDVATRARRSPRSAPRPPPAPPRSARRPAARPQTGCSTFGTADFIRVPCPAAMIRTVEALTARIVLASGRSGPTRSPRERGIITNCRRSFVARRPLTIVRDAPLRGGVAGSTPGFGPGSGGFKSSPRNYSLFRGRLPALRPPLLARGRPAAGCRGRASP